MVISPLHAPTLPLASPSPSPAPAHNLEQDPELLRFVDLECFLWSTVNADLTPLINAGMVFCDRHYGGINYPVGGVGRIPEEMAEGIQELGSYVEYKANVKVRLLGGEGCAGWGWRNMKGMAREDGRE